MSKSPAWGDASSVAKVVDGSDATITKPFTDAFYGQTKGAAASGRAQAGSGACVLEPPDPTRFADIKARAGGCVLQRLLDRSL